MKVFLSHSAKAAGFALKAAGVLREQGLDVWLAEEQVMPGDNYATLIGEALGSCDAMVVLLTPDKDDAQMTNYEMSYALGEPNYRKKVFPLIVTNHESMAVSKSLVPWIYSNRTQTVRPAGLGAKLKIIAQALGVASEHTATVAAAR